MYVIKWLSDQNYLLQWVLASKPFEIACFTFCLLSQFFCMRSLSFMIKHMNSLHTFDFSGDTNCASKNIKECQVWQIGQGRNAHLWTNQSKFSVTLTDMVQYIYCVTTCFIWPGESSRWVVDHLVGNVN
jgi:hypothetical protein